MKQEPLEQAIPESQLLEALHEVVHMLDIEDLGYEVAKEALSTEVERQTEMRAWRMLVDFLGHDIPAATERFYRELLERLGHG